jgi:hypothetical protein
MAEIVVRGHIIKLKNIPAPSVRRAQTYLNEIISCLRKLGVDPDDVECKIPLLVTRGKSAEVMWWMPGHNCYISYAAQPRFIDNLYVISKIIQEEFKLIESGQKSIHQFVESFQKEEDLNELQKKARVTLGVPEDCNDLATINSAYKKLAIKFHPDKDDGDEEKFKKINNAHKVLKKELS